MFFWLGLQSTVTSLFLLMGMTILGKDSSWILTGELPYVISILANAVTFAAGYIWLQKREKQEKGKITPFSMAALLFLGLTLQLFFSLLLIYLTDHLHALPYLPDHHQWNLLPT